MPRPIRSCNASLLESEKSSHVCPCIVVASFQVLRKIRGFKIFCLSALGRRPVFLLGLVERIIKSGTVPFLGVCLCNVEPRDVAVAADLAFTVAMLKAKRSGKKSVKT